MSFRFSLLVALALPLIPASPLAAQPDCLVVPITNNGGNSFRPSVDGAFVAFASDSDLTGGNPDLNQEIFLWDGATITQITDTTSGSSVDPSLDGGEIAFSSTADLTGGNPDANSEIFLWDGAAFTQVTDTSVGACALPSLEGRLHHLPVDVDITGGNADGASRSASGTAP